MSEHPRSTPAIGAMAEGLRDQLRHFWLHALRMLYEPQGHRAEVEMECRGVCPVDDLKVMYAPAGINNDADRVHVDYYQIKFHVSQADHVNAEALINPKSKGTKDPMLRRLSKPGTSSASQR